MQGGAASADGTAARAFVSFCTDLDTRCWKCHPIKSPLRLICGPCGEELKEGQPRYRKMKAHHACVLALKAIDRLGNKNPKVSGTKYKTYYIYISKALVRTRGVVALSIVR